MVEPCPVDLSYGHFGVPKYDVENNKWHFPRRSENGRQLRPIGNPKTILEAAPAPGSDVRKKTAKDRKKEIEHLATALPELVAGSSILPALCEESETICENDPVSDSTVSERFAFGRAVHPEHTSHRPKAVPVIAVASGLTGESVRIIRLNDANLGWPGDKGVKLTTKALRAQEYGIWSSNGSQIQQLRFAFVHDQPSEWLAVRYQGATSILRPVLRDSAFSADYSTYSHVFADNCRVRQIDPNHIVTLPISRTGGTPHADVCFNPWNPLEFAILDQVGGWSTWSIESLNVRKGVWKVRPGCSGRLPELTSGPTMESNRRLFTWGAILWADTPMSLIVVRPRMFALQDLSDPSKRLSSPDLALAGSSDRILDVKRSSSNVFVLTTSRVFWLHMLSENDFSGQVKFSIKVLLSWVHFRNADDTSLRISVLEDGATYFVVLCSSLTNLQTLHMFQLANSSPKFPLSVRDPCIFSINDFEHPTANPVTISLIIAPYTQGKTPDPTAIGQAYMKSAVRFYQLFLLSDNLCLKEYFYIEFPTEFENEIVFPNVLSRPTTPQSPYRIQDDFVVPNGILVDEIEDGEIKRALSRYRQINNEYVSDVLKEDPWTINFEWLAKLLNSPTSFLSSGPRHLQSYIPMSQALGLIESEASNASTTDRSELSSLLDLVKDDLYVEDIDSSSSLLQQMLQNSWQSSADAMLDNGNQFDGQTVFTSLIPRSTAAILSNAPETSLLQFYNWLIDMWITSLPRHIPALVRLQQEKIIRDISAQLYLASVAIRPYIKPILDFQDHPRSTRLQSSNFELPVKGINDYPLTHVAKGKQREQEKPSSSLVGELPSSTGEVHLMSGALLPTPEPPPSLRSQPSSSSLYSTTSFGSDSHTSIDREDANMAESGAGVRLRRLGAKLRPQPALSRVIERDILGHWQLGTDPEEYDWENVERSLQSVEKEKEGEVEDERERRRLKKRRRVEAKEKAAKRVRETEGGGRDRGIEVGMDTGLTLGERMTHSSPPQIRGQGSSQVTVDVPLGTSTQPERGRWGGGGGLVFRKKKAGAERKPGF